MKIYGLIGFPLGHSFSRNYFLEKFRREKTNGYEYLNFSFELLNEGIHQLKKNPDLLGLNVTIPFKESIIQYLDKTSPVCNEIKSCNCIRIENGVWTGYNTDVIGFEKSLTPLLADSHKDALVFGTGGASKAVCYVLKKLGINYRQVSRRQKRNCIQYREITPEILNNFTLLVNTTPVGMFPNVDECLPIPYGAITDKHLVYDLIYNPEETLFLKKAKFHGAVIKNGGEMLVIQAEESWKIWNKSTIEQSGAL